MASAAAAIFSNFACRRKQTSKLRAQPILTDGADGLEVTEIETSTLLPDERWQWGPGCLYLQLSHEPGMWYGFICVCVWMGGGVVEWLGPEILRTRLANWLWWLCRLTVSWGTLTWERDARRWKERRSARSKVDNNIMGVMGSGRYKGKQSRKFLERQP